MTRDELINAVEHWMDLAPLSDPWMPDFSVAWESMKADAALGRKVWEADRIPAWIDAGVSARECLAKMSEMMRQHDWYDAAIYLDNLADALKEMEHE